MKRIVANGIGKTAAVLRSVPVRDRDRYPCLLGMNAAGIPAFEALRIESTDDLTQLYIQLVAGQFGTREVSDHLGGCQRFAWGDAVGLAFPWLDGRRPPVNVLKPDKFKREFFVFKDLKITKEDVLVFGVVSRGAGPVNSVLWRLEKELGDLELLNKEAVGFHLENFGPHPQSIGEVTTPELAAFFAIEIDSFRNYKWDGK